MGQLFRNLTKGGLGGLLAWVHKSMNYILIGMTVVLYLSLRSVESDNETLSANLAEAITTVDQISTTLEGYEEALGEINQAVTSVQATQAELRAEARSVYTFIDEVARDENRADDPFWNAYFDRLRDSASRAED